MRLYHACPALCLARAGSPNHPQAARAGRPPGRRVRRLRQPCAASCKARPLDRRHRRVPGGRIHPVCRRLEDRFLVERASCSCRLASLSPARIAAGGAGRSAWRWCRWSRWRRSPSASPSNLRRSSSWGALLPTTTSSTKRPAPRSGALAWLPLGGLVVGWLQSLAPATGSRTEMARRVLTAYYAAIWLLLGLLPFDVTIRPAELAEKFRMHRIRLVPLHDGLLGGSEVIASTALLAIPIGALAALGWPRSRRVPHAIYGALAGALVVAALEFCQLFVFSRTATVDDVIGGSIGAGVGAWLATRLAGTNGSDTAPARLKLWPLALLLAWVFRHPAAPLVALQFRGDRRHVAIAVARSRAGAVQQLLLGEPVRRAERGHHQSLSRPARRRAAGACGAAPAEPGAALAAAGGIRRGRRGALQRCRTGTGLPAVALSGRHGHHAGNDRRGPRRGGRLPGAIGNRRPPPARRAT